MSNKCFLIFNFSCSLETVSIRAIFKIFFDIFRFILFGQYFLADYVNHTILIIIYQSNKWIGAIIVSPLRLFICNWMIRSALIRLSMVNNNVFLDFIRYDSVIESNIKSIEIKLKKQSITKAAIDSLYTVLPTNYDGL